MENLSVEQVTLIVIGILLAISFLTAIISLILETDRSRQWYGDWFQGVSTEMIGAAVTTIFFAFIVGAVQEQQAQSQLKKDLIGQLGSTINSEAVRASEELRDEGWLRDGSLREADLSFADLSGAILFYADLRDATLFSITLKAVDLSGANLSRANLQAADLDSANLEAADLQEAYLETANLHGANLLEADLRGANLTHANLEGAALTGTQFDEATILPDESTWTEETDLARFTDPDHADFWRPQPTEDGDLPWWMAE
jgi:hypothetical protein